MSRIGKLAIARPSNTEVVHENGVLSIKGKKGTLSYPINGQVLLDITDSEIVVKPVSTDRFSTSMWGTLRSIINSYVIGVNEGFVNELELVGVGYRVAASNNILTLTLGYSHDIKYIIPDDISVSIEKGTQLKIEGISKQKVGQITAELMALRPFEPYKGKGVFIKGNPGRRKEGKKK